MSPCYVGKNVGAYTKDPYAEAKASLRSAASKKYYSSRFYEIQSGRRGDYNTGSLYGGLKELQQEVF